MFVLVSKAEGPASAQVREIDNFRELAVKIDGVSDEAAEVAVGDAGFGEFEGEHAWLDTSALRACGSDGTEWQASYDGMLAYAGKSGWLNPDGSRVRAHIIRL